MFDFLTDEYIYRLAPDGKSVKAALDLVQSRAFRSPQRLENARRLQAACQGSERRPYAVEVDLADPDSPSTGCTCSSYKRPCKHALGLLFLAAHSPESFAGGEPRTKRTSALQSAPPREAATVEERPPADLREALLQAILAEPEDVTARLVYADWLEEHGSAEEAPRAEFIRVQIELARLPEGAKQAAPLLRREKKLWHAHKAEWLAHLPPHLRTKKAIRFHRGFLEELSVPPAAWAKHGKKLFEKNPIFRVRLPDLIDRHTVGDLVVIPDLARIRELSLADNPISHPLTTLGILFDTPFLSGLRRLRMGTCGLGSRELGLLIESPLLARLVELDLPDNGVGPSGVKTLAESPATKGLRKLSLARNPVGDVGGKALAASPHLDALERLDLSDVELADRVKAALQDRFGDRVVLG